MPKEVLVQPSQPATQPGLDLWVDTDEDPVWTPDPSQDTGWISLGLPAGGVTIAGGGTPGYRRLNGVTYLRGSFQNVPTGVSTTIYTLPVGFRPIENLYTTSQFNTTAQQGVAVITNGQIQLYASSSTAAYHSMGAINFIADN